MKRSFYSHANKTNFHFRVCAPPLALIGGLKIIRKEHIKVSLLPPEARGRDGWKTTWHEGEVVYSLVIENREGTS